MDGSNTASQIENELQWRYVAIRNYRLVPSGDVLLELHQTAGSPVTTVDMMFRIAASYWRQIFVSNGEGGWKCPGLNETLDKMQLKERIDKVIDQQLFQDASFDAVAKRAYLAAQENAFWGSSPMPAVVWPVEAEQAINGMSYDAAQTSLRSETASAANPHTDPLSTKILLGTVDAPSAIVISGGATGTTQSTSDTSKCASLLPW